MNLDLSALRRYPDFEAPDLLAVDAADRLILDESATTRALLSTGELVVIGDSYGALTLAAASAGARGIRVHQDALTGEHALASNATELNVAPVWQHHPLDAGLVRGAKVVLLRLPRSLDELTDIAGLIAAYADTDVQVYAGGRIKHMSLSMNDRLAQFFDRVDISHARQKSRVLVSRGPHDGRDPVAAVGRSENIELRAFGGVFAGARIDIGTRLLLSSLPDVIAAPAIDLACGSGVVAAALALSHNDLRVIACDQSAAAVASAHATVAANGVADRVSVLRDDGLSMQPDNSASFVALNPPFHTGAAVSDQLAPRLFADAARVLKSGGELWCVWNTPLHYRPILERVVGPTRQIARNAKFTVTASVAR